jgi:hypothetical protein
MAKHASAKQVRLLDTLAAYWALAVVWFRILFGLRPPRGEHALVAWPTDDPDFGADPDFVDTLQIMNLDPVVRPEARA